MSYSRERHAIPGTAPAFTENLTDRKDRKMSTKFDVFQELYDVAVDRKNNPKEGSYTNYLFDKGIDKICKKVGEEAAEVIIAAKNNNPDEIRYEVADLIYHLTVLLVNQGLTWDEICLELQTRRK